MYSFQWDNISVMRLHFTTNTAIPERTTSDASSLPPPGAAEDCWGPPLPRGCTDPHGEHLILHFSLPAQSTALKYSATFSLLLSAESLSLSRGSNLRT